MKLTYMDVLVNDYSCTRVTVPENTTAIQEVTCMRRLYTQTHPRRSRGCTLRPTHGDREQGTLLYTFDISKSVNDRAHTEGIHP